MDKTDKLDEIFDMQKQLDDYIAQKRGLNFSKEEWVQKRSLALIVELGEALTEANYKWWKKADGDRSQRLKEELADVLHFFVGMCIDAGLTADELYRIYTDKNSENVKRQLGESNQKDYRA